MEKLNIVSYSPHIKSHNSTFLFQLFTILALVGLSAWGTYIYGIKSIIVILSCVTATVITEILFNLCYYKRFVFDNLSSIVVGLSIGLALPPNLPFYCGIIGSILSILLIKFACGGLGKNFVSEVAFGKVITYIMFSATISTSYVMAGSVESGATTLAETTKLGQEVSTSLLDIVLGKTVGAIGETSILLILVLGIVLCLTKAIDWKIPFFYLFTLSIAGLLFVDVSLYMQFLASSGIFFVAFFVATDFGSAPNAAIGKIIFASCAGLLTVFIWELGNYILAPYFAVLICELVFSAFTEYFNPKLVITARGK